MKVMQCSFVFTLFHIGGSLCVLAAVTDIELMILCYVVTIPLLIGHSGLIIILSFQCFLIIPKVYQPLWRQLKRKAQLVRHYQLH